MTPTAMTVVMPTGGIPQWSTDRGTIREAWTVPRRVRAFERSTWHTEQSHIRRERARVLSEAFRGCSRPDWDGYGAAPASDLSMWWAKQVLAAFPSRLGVPEIAFEPDGDAGLEWWRGQNRVLSVSIGRNGELRYAARLNSARVIGTEMFADGLPKRLVEAAYDLMG